MALVGVPISDLLSQAEVDALEEGALIDVTWTGGNGPHEYRVGIKHGRRYAMLFGADGHVVGALDFVGKAGYYTHVRRLLDSDQTEPR